MRQRDTAASRAAEQLTAALRDLEHYMSGDFACKGFVSDAEDRIKKALSLLARV